MSGTGRLTVHELERLRRSVAATGQLPRDQIERLLEQAQLLVCEREAVLGALASLGPPWNDARRALNTLHRALLFPSRELPDHTSGGDTPS